jgi:ketosteroid isomerase-like protein
MTAHPTALDVFDRAMTLMQTDNIEWLVALCDEDIVMEFPFAPQPAPWRIEGKEALSKQLKARVAWRLSAPKVDNLTVYECTDPTTLIAETMVRGRAPPRAPAIAVVQVCDGLMTLYRDYWNPLDLMASKKAPSGRTDG